MRETDLLQQLAASSAEGADGLDTIGFKQLFRQHPAGVAVITFAGPEGPMGFTATSVISVSAAPPMLAFAIAASSSTWQTLQQAQTVLVNFLDAPSAHLSARFARRGTDRFAGVEHRRLPTGEPLLTEAAAWVRSRVAQHVPTGESHLVTLHALEAQIARTSAPLVYHDRTYHGLGQHSRL
ncbi:flavin reductase family protein [Ruania albidiflava]|uniref:flavin reductase family protein n=1 Tax=Ruania albidiflava TaxID=366586 RepID=UPI0003B45EE5|nr:flavin reductase family protein [Ruania albidiflava]